MSDNPQFWTKVGVERHMLPSGVAEYLTTQAYAVGSWVWSSVAATPGLYVCKMAIAYTPGGAPNPWDATKWSSMQDVSSMFSDNNPVIAAKQASLEYSSSKSYGIGEPCIYQNALYTRIYTTDSSDSSSSSSSAGEPWNHNHWKKVGDLVGSVVCGSGSTQQTITPENGTADVSALFTSANTSTDPQPSGLLQNATLDKAIVKVCNSIVGTANADLEDALGGNA